MKRTIKTVATVLLAALAIQGCKKEEPAPQNKSSILPAHFSIDVPESISKDNSASKSGVDTLDGNEIYRHLTTFIAVGEGGAKIVEGIMMAIAVYGINKPMSLSYKSDEDGRTKNLEVVENSTFEGAAWQYQLTISDALSAGNADKGNAIQVFWNLSPIKGIAILKPYNIERDKNIGAPDAMIRIDYSEAGEFGYDAHEIVSISGLPMASPLQDPYSMRTLKMFAGRKGDVVDVYGNSNHPNAKFFSSNSGFNWAFTASGSKTADIGVAEVGLPPSTLDETKRDVLLKDYSIENVFTNEIYAVWPGIDSNAVKGYLYNTEAPGFFDKHGFIQGGTAPSAGYTGLLNSISKLSPYNPKEVSNMEIQFKQ